MESRTDQTPPGGGKLQRLTKPAGLRAHLAAGVVIISLVSTALVGLITRWAVVQGAEERGQVAAEVLGQALADTLASQLDSPSTLQQLVGRLQRSADLVLLEVVAPNLQMMARSGLAPREDQTSLRQAMHSREQVTLRTPENFVEVCTPMLLHERLRGIVRLRLSLSSAADSPTLFWQLMGAYGLALVAFVTLVLTLYVARPLEAMQRAAARIAAGDLDCRLDPSGAYEMDSLADSLNQMASALKEQLTRLEDQRRTLIQSEKLASVGRLAAGVAHEIGNPMQSIIGFADILETQIGARREAEPQESDKQLDLLRRIQAEAARIHETIRELLEFARPAKGEVTAVSLREVVEQALSLLHPQKRFSEIQVSIEPAVSELPDVAANATQLVQVVVNLLLNAADAIGAEGSEGKVAIGGAVDPANEGQVMLTIANDGPPITQPDRGKLFEPFFTTKDPGQGSGLGLAVSRSIVESFEGTLVLREHTPVVFALHLPRFTPRH